MKFSFSNIAWTPHDSAEVLAILQKNKISGIEVAPTKIWPDWQGANYKSAVSYKKKLREKGFEIPALQAILFNKPEAKLFDSIGEEKLIEHLKLVAEIAEGLGAKVVVFGAPKQRDRGNLTHDQALNYSVNIFRKIAEIFAAHSVKFCIEPNPKEYSCNFINNIDQAEELVRKVDHKGFGLHLDSAAMFLEKDDLQKKWSKIFDIVQHFHISEPNLGDFESVEINHALNVKTLNDGGYHGWFSVEMRESKIPFANNKIFDVLKKIYE